MSTENSTHKVGVIMGSSSDLKVMHQAADALAEFGIEAEVAVVSAHRTPEAMVEYAKAAAGRGLRVIIAGAGGAADLPVMWGAMTIWPSIEVARDSSNANSGCYSVLSILQMPGGVPVATVALDGGKNAGILAAEMIGAFDPVVAKKLADYKEALKEKVKEMNDGL